MKSLHHRRGRGGRLLGGLAAEGGHEVCFAGSPSSMRELAARGLRLVLPSGRLRFRKVLTADLVRPAGGRSWALSRSSAISFASWARSRWPPGPPNCWC